MCEASKRSRSELSSSSSVSSPLTKLRHLSEGGSPFKTDMLGDNPQTISEVLTPQTLQAMLDKIKHQIVEEINLKYEKTVEHLESRVHELEINNDKLEEKIKLQEAEISSLKDSLSNVNNSTLRLRQLAVQNQQYSRKANVRIFGIEENSNIEGRYGNENCVNVVKDLFEQKLGVQLRDRDIDTAHRVGREDDRSRRGPRAILVKFLRRADKERVIRNRKKLKGSKTIIVDDLCREMHELFNRVSNDPRVESAWTYNGKIFIKDKHGRKHHVQYGELLPNLPTST